MAKDQLDELLQLARTAGIDVRTERLRGSATGGFCRIGGAPVIFLNRQLRRNLRAQILRRSLEDAGEQGLQIDWNNDKHLKEKM